MSSAVTQELARMSNTVRGIGQDASNFALSKEKLGLEGALQEHNISRQKSADARADELYEQGAAGRKLRLNEDTAALEAYNKPFGYASLGPDALEHGMHELKNGKLAGEQWGEVLGYTFDKDPNSPTHTLFLKDGEVVPSGSVNRRHMEAAMRAYMRPDLKARTRHETNDANLAAKKITPQQHTLIREQIFEQANNIPMQIGENETVIKTLSEIGTPAAQKRIEELERKNDNMAKEWRTRKAADKRAAVRLKAGTKEKDNRGKLQKDAEYMASVVPGLTPEMALEKIFSDKKAASMVSAFVRAVDNLPETVKYNTKKRAEAVERLKDAYQIEKFMQTDIGPQKTGLGANPGGGAIPNWKTFDQNRDLKKDR